MRAVVVAGGAADPRDVAVLEAADLVLAADSGAAWLATVGRRPDRLVGDLDSLGSHFVAELEASGVTVERHPADKDETDAELALERAVELGADEITVLGALAGERLDHEVANLLLIADPRWAGAVRDLRVVHGSTLVRPLHGPGSLDLEAPVGAIVSLLPLGGDASGVACDGLRYPLENARLAFGRSRGISNVVVRAPASVSLQDGLLLVVEILEGVQE
jgi:thiamine pyrophosphokinase